ncbi:hypothetical protein PTKIN_Ptkin17bG0154500 [Pterospermum kingtungense]
MASRLAIAKRTGLDSGSLLGLRRYLHASALPPPLDAPISQPTASQSLVLPESDQIPDGNSNNVIGFGFGFPSFPFGGSMELMAVPKKKVSRHKRGIRNGPKALKPIPVIIRCKSCGRVKLPHFFCCSGDRGQTGERGEDRVTWIPWLELISVLECDNVNNETYGYNGSLIAFTTRIIG